MLFAGVCIDFGNVSEEGSRDQAASVGAASTIQPGEAA